MFCIQYKIQVAAAADSDVYNDREEEELDEDPDEDDDKDAAVYVLDGPRMNVSIAAYVVVVVDVAVEVLCTVLPTTFLHHRREKCFSSFYGRHHSRDQIRKLIDLIS